MERPPARRTSRSGWLVLAALATGAAYGVTHDLWTAVAALAGTLVVAVLATALSSRE